MLRKIGVVIALFGMLTVTQAQSTLGDLVAGAGVDWLMGQWQSENDSSDNAVLVTFKGDLDNHIAWVTHKDQRGETKGMVVVDPASGEVKYFAGSSLGGFGTGVWTAEDKKAILKYKYTAADGKTTQMGITFAKLDANTMEVKIFELNDKNEMADDARWTGKLIRKK